MKVKKRQHFYQKKRFLWSLGIVIGFVLAIALAFRLSPWPGALIIRTVFNKGGNSTLAAMQQALPDYPVQLTKDIKYGTEKTMTLDVYRPKQVVSTDAKLPVVIWTHGGAWLSGNKAAAGPYYERLADQGYIVVSVGYSLAPGATYPTPIRQLNEAHRYVISHGDDYNIDTTQVFLAGDSAGAQLSSQLASLVSNPGYAKQMDITPSLQPEQLKGVILYCGIYKMEGLTEPNPNLSKLVSWGDATSVWAYTGSRDKASPAIRQMSAYYHATKDFPATFISGGNADPLTDAQSKPFAKKLTEQGVRVQTLFYPSGHKPELPHEYQFTFNADGERAFTQMTMFLGRQGR